MRFKSPFMLLLPLFCLILAGAAVSCSTEDYETGDGKWSYLRAEFADVHSSEAKKLDYALTDVGDSLRLEPLHDCEWAKTPDSLYRVLLYYKVKPNLSEPVEAISVSQVLTLGIKKAKDIEKIFTDPVKMESAWVSKNGKYLNMGLFVKTGVQEGIDAKQTLGLVCDTIMAREDGTRLFCLRLYHDQNGVPEYYSSKLYASIPLAYLSKGDNIRLQVETYDGTFIREF